MNHEFVYACTNICVYLSSGDTINKLEKFMTAHWLLLYQKSRLPSNDVNINMREFQSMT